MDEKRPIIWIKLEGPEIVKDHKVDAYLLGQILTNIQKQINIIAEAKYGKKLKSHFRLFLSEIKKGSANIGLEYSSSWFEREFLQKQIDVIETHYTIYDLIDKKNEKELDLFLLRELKEPVNVYRLLGSVETIIPSSVKYKIGLSKWEPKKFVIVKPERKELVSKLKNKYQQQATVELIGVIMELYGKDPRHFEIETIMGEKFKVYFKPELEPQLKELYKSIVKLKGLSTKKAKVKEILKILNISPLNTLEVNEIGKFQLKKPLKLSINYLLKDNLWVLENKELVIYGHGKSYQEALKELEESLESLIIGFLAFKDEHLAESSKRIKQKLIEYIDLKQMRNKYQPKVVQYKAIAGE